MSSEISASDTVEMLLPRPELGDSDLKYLSLDQLRCEHDEAIYRCQRAQALIPKAQNCEEKASLISEYQLWDTRKKKVAKVLSEALSEEEKKLQMKIDEDEKKFNIPTEEIIRDINEPKKVTIEKEKKIQMKIDEDEKKYNILIEEIIRDINEPKNVTIEKEMSTEKQNRDQHTTVDQATAVAEQYIGTIYVNVESAKVTEDFTANDSNHNTQSVADPEEKELGDSDLIDISLMSVAAEKTPIPESQKVINSNYIPQSLVSVGLIDCKSNPAISAAEIGAHDDVISASKNGHSLAHPLIFGTGITIAALTLSWVGWYVLKKRGAVARTHARQWNITDEPLNLAQNPS